MNYQGSIPTLSSQHEQSSRQVIRDIFNSSPIPDSEMLYNLPLFINRQNLSRVFHLKSLYEQILDVHGVIMEFGVRWGQNLALFSALRGMLEPFNFSRKVIGFDTFDGFPSVHEKDNKFISHKKGDLGVSKDYEDVLGKILQYHESECPNPHIKKHEIVKGDATKTVANYLERNPQTIISFAYFDMDIYEPTVEVLKQILPYCTKGTILGFDELNCSIFPGETVAVREILGTDNFKVHRSPLDPYGAYIVL